MIDFLADMTVIEGLLLGMALVAGVNMLPYIIVAPLAILDYVVGRITGMYD